MGRTPLFLTLRDLFWTFSLGPRGLFTAASVICVLVDDFWTFLESAIRPEIREVEDMTKTYFVLLMTFLAEQSAALFKEPT